MIGILPQRCKFVVLHVAILSIFQRESRVGVTRPRAATVLVEQHDCKPYFHSVVECNPTPASSVTEGELLFRSSLRNIEASIKGSA